MEKIELIENLILGDTDKISPEKYFITLTTLIASFFLLALCLFHLIMGLKIAPVFLAASSSLLMLGLYYLIRFKNSLLIPKIILTVGGLIMLDFTWYSKFLSNGPVLFFILIFAALVIWVWNGKKLGVLLIFYFVNLVVLFFIDYNAPEYLFKYKDHQTRSIDIFLSLFLYSILLIFLLYIIKREFLKQNAKIDEINNLYLGLFNNATIGLYQTTPSGKVISANLALIKMLKFDSLEDLLQRDLTRGSYVDINKRTEFKKIIHEIGEINNYESEWYTKNGDILVVLESAKAVKNNKSEIIRYDGTVQDITEKREIERKLIESKEKAEESDRLKSAFLANMSHEIRTPMNGILGFADLLKDPELSGEQQKQYIKIIEKSGARMLNIINNIVDLSKIEAGLMKVEIRETNINEQIEYIYTFFKPEVEAKGINFKYINTLPFNKVTLKTDSEKLYAILTNLVKNAIKYTHKGKIEFGYNLVENQSISTLVFYVKDTGIGIPLDRQNAIFERFIQADITDKMARQGAGLGLSISKAYIEMLGGGIWVESEEGIGSTFYFSLPYNAELAKEIFDQQLVPSEKINIRKLKILIAEDDEVSEMLIDISVKAFCKEILKVKTGFEAVETCRKNSDIDLILMDIQMPEMNGHEATRQIRQFNKEVVIFAQTAFGLAGDREKSLASGCNDYISKPINKFELLALIQKYFRQ